MSSGSEVLLTEARAETLRYHETLYAQGDGSDAWLTRPAPFVLDAIAYLPADRPVRVLDLGAGNGRHTLPAAAHAAEGSCVLALDLLPSALDSLSRRAHAAGLADRIQLLCEDFHRCSWRGDTFDLVIACSALEHAPGLLALERQIRDLQAATPPGGLHCLVIGVERHEVSESGAWRPAFIETPLNRADVEALFDRHYAGWEWLARSAADFHVDETRAGERYQLHNRCERLLARKPGR